MKYKIADFIILLNCFLQMLAVVVKPGPIQARQPDGTTITIKMEGTSTRDGDVFPGLYEKDEFILMTTPSLRSLKRKSLDIDLKEIKEEPGGSISGGRAVDRC